jgi:hypothetical protein
MPIVLQYIDVRQELSLCDGLLKNPETWPLNLRSMPELPQEIDSVSKYQISWEFKFRSLCRRETLDETK